MAPVSPVVPVRMRFKNVPERRTAGDRGRKLLWLIVVMGLVSAGLVALILYTLPRTTMSVEGLFVHASIVALSGFLLILVFRYFTILGAAFLFITRYSAVRKSPVTPFVSIIVPVYNEAKILRQSIDSLLDLDYEQYEIIIVNDGSTDTTGAVGEALAGFHEGRHGQRVRVVLINKPNGGKSSALNAGIQYSKAEYVLCMDGDSQLSPDTLRAGMRHFVDPEIGAVAGNVKVLNRRKMLSKLQALEYVEGLNMLRSAQSAMGLVNIIPGPIGIFRKKAVRAAGWYSGDTFAEDADLSLNLRLAGWKIVYEPEAISYTEAPERLHQLLKQRYRWTRGILQAIRKHRRELFRSREGFATVLVLWTLLFEAVVWPIMNIFANVFFIVVALLFGLSTTIALWWASIALMDVMTALYCVAVDREETRLVSYALIYRVVFLLIVDVTKFGATIEEVLGLRMSWGKLERIGAGEI